MSAPAPRPLKLQVIDTSTRRKHIFSEVNPAMTIQTLQTLIEQQFNRPVPLQALYVAGIPPRPLPLADPSASLTDLGLRAGDSIELREVEESAGATEMKQGKGEWTSIGFIQSNQGRFERREMPSDNSCLFHAISYVCGKQKTGAPAALRMRELAANLVASDPETYNTVFLGSPNHLYQDHLLNPNTWGGGIELSLFARNFQTEIVAFDIAYLREDRFGAEEGYTKRAFVLYTGKHYDALVWKPLTGGSEQTLFNTKDETAWARARDLVESLHNELAAQGKCTKQTEWRYNKSLKRSNLASKEADREREKRVRAEQARTTSSSVASMTAAAAAPSTSSVPPAASSSTATTAPAATPASSLPVPAADEWTCNVCTCINPNSRRRCQACDTENPNATSQQSFSGTTVAAPTSTATSASGPSSTDSNGFNCVACTAWNEGQKSHCSVCGTNQMTGEVPHSASSAAAQPIDLSGEDEDGIRAPLPQREQQLIGGEDDYMPMSQMGVGMGPFLTAQQRQQLSQAWTCEACTMRNDPFMTSCATCNSPHPMLREAASNSSSSNGGSNRSGGGRVRSWFGLGGGREEAPWICERCGKSQSPQLYCCSNCKLVNTGLQMRVAAASDGCAIM